MKRIVIVLLLALLAGSAFAESKINSSWEKSYYKDNAIHLYASVGWAYGLCAAVHGEWIISEFSWIGTVAWGVGIQAAF